MSSHWQSPRTDTVTLKRNTVLPAELLCMIFRYLASEVFYSNLDRPYKEVSHSRDCLTLTHVCSFWRTVALHDPYLWGYSLCSPPQRISSNLNQSGNAPLYIRWSDEKSEATIELSLLLGLSRPASRAIVQGLAHVFKQSNRIREVYVEDCITAGPLHDLAYPHLTSLELGPKSAAQRRFIWYSPPKSYYSSFDTTLPPASKLPLLSNLRLAIRSFAWQNLHGLSNLSTLRLERDQGDITVTRSRNHRLHVLEALGSMPNLRSLTLIHSLPYYRSDVPSNSLTIYLLNLAELVLYDTPKRCAWFLARVGFPITTHRTVTGEVRTESADDDPDDNEPDSVSDDEFLHLAKRPFHCNCDDEDDDSDESTFKAMTLDFLRMDTGERGGGGIRKFVHMRAWRKMPIVYIHNLPHDPSDANLTLTASWFPNSHYDATLLADQFIMGSHLAHLTYLAITIPSLYHAVDEWLTIFHADDLPRLTTLSIAGSQACAAFIRMLALNRVLAWPHGFSLRNAIWTQKRPPLILKKLESLTLIDADLECRVEPEGYSTYRMLLRTLAMRIARTRAGKGFELKFVRCRIRTFSVKQLTEVVPNLYWDGREDRSKDRGEDHVVMEEDEDGLIWSDGKAYVEI